MRTQDFDNFSQNLKMKCDKRKNYEEEIRGLMKDKPGL